MTNQSTAELTLNQKRFDWLRLVLVGSIAASLGAPLPLALALGAQSKRLQAHRRNPRGKYPERGWVLVKLRVRVSSSSQSR